jgi:hypothetical protein
MAEMESPRVGSEYRHVQTDEQVTVVEHVSRGEPKTAFIVEGGDGEREKYDHPAQFYENYLEV